MVLLSGLMNKIFAPTLSTLTQRKKMPNKALIVSS